MALSAPTLSALIRSKLLDADCGCLDSDELTGFCDAIAEAVVEHVVAEAEVTPGTLETDPGGESLTGTGGIT